MLPPGLDTPTQVKRYYEGRYDALIASGQFVPFLYPWATVGFGVILVYLLIDHRQSLFLQSLRYPLFGLLCAFEAWCLSTNRARSPPGGYGVGLLSAWGTLWTAAVMVFNDFQTDFKRIERADQEALSKGVANGATTVSPANGAAKSNYDHVLQAADSKATQGPAKRQGPLFWQGYPVQPFVERLDWTIDLFSNFRGVGWNFETYGIPPLPDHVQVELSCGQKKPPKANEIKVSKTGIQRFNDRTSLLWYAFIRLVIGAILLDVIKLMMHHDAYFWGYMDAAPPTYLPSVVRSSAVLVRSYRLLLSLCAICVALNEMTRIGPLFFAGLLGPNWIGVRGEPWSNPPDFWGSFSRVLDKGLAGWWGAWWHQLFRFGFGAPTTSLLELLSIDKHSQAGKTIATLVAFFISGCLHACGSYTQLGDTRPFAGPFLFFVLQAFAILAQTAAANVLETVGIMSRTPKLMRQLMNFILVHVWLYHTAPLLVDDFAKGGVWLYEPLAISPLRILGFGVRDDTGWGLWNGLISWRQGDHWWDTGLAF